MLSIGRTIEELNMAPKATCDVLSNNKGYYKEVFDYHIFSIYKIGEFR